MTENHSHTIFLSPIHPQSSLFLSLSNKHTVMFGSNPSASSHPPSCCSSQKNRTRGGHWVRRRGLHLGPQYQSVQVAAPVQLPIPASHYCSPREAAGGSTRIWTPATLVGRPKLSSKLLTSVWSSPAVRHLRVNPWTGNLSPPPSLSGSVFQIK